MSARVASKKIYGRFVARLLGGLLGAWLVYGAYRLGSLPEELRPWPLPQLRSWKARLAHAPIEKDAAGRLLAYPGKVQIPCPAQTPRTAVLLLIGQSNAGNHHGQRYRGVDDRVVNFAAGRCWRAQSPLLGAEGEYGEAWTLLANQLVATQRFDRVILLPAAVGNSAVHRWAPGGDLHAMLLDVVRDASPRYVPTHVLWHQGEADYRLHTTEAAYAASLAAMIAALRGVGVAAPIYIARASFVPEDPGWTADNPVTAAQRAMPDGTGIFAGPDTDRLIAPLDRFDGVHFSMSGQEKFAADWLQRLR